MTDSVLISIISALSGIVMTFITMRYRNQPTNRKARDRIDTAFDMYEGMIKNLKEEIKRKDAVIARLSKEDK